MNTQRIETKISPSSPAYAYSGQIIVFGPCVLEDPDKPLQLAPWVPSVFLSLREKYAIKVFSSTRTEQEVREFLHNVHDLVPEVVCGIRFRTAVQRWQRKGEVITPENVLVVIAKGSQVKPFKKAHVCVGFAEWAREEETSGLPIDYRLNIRELFLLHPRLADS